ncbi:DUF1801 domain-containing protein [Winogradskyella sp.]|uniref:DUF1801 domain-containing protein n=1 Tax=Winogradskyella sp. TaxID=1883156 RepID=UPI00260896A0|nr:DUF1801 domain-containing protein [Winogradskyella sp.]
MNPNVTTYIESLDQWQDELSQLRKTILSCNLKEEYKWMRPCYTIDGKNIVLIHEFKDYCAISFFKGALLKDHKSILVKPTENSQAGRQIRFTSLEEINKIKTSLKNYIFEAIAIENLGLKVAYKTISEYEIPEELLEIFEEDIEFKKAFNALTPGRQKGYLLHFTKPKQSKTRLARIKKNRQRIFDGFGLTDCTCGLSKRKPNCDGSHKQLLKM